MTTTVAGSVFPPSETGFRRGLLQLNNAAAEKQEQLVATFRNLCSQGDHTQDASTIDGKTGLETDVLKTILGVVAFHPLKPEDMKVSCNV